MKIMASQYNDQSIGTLPAQELKNAGENLASFMAPVADLPSSTWSNAFNESSFEVINAIDGGELSSYVPASIEEQLLAETRQLQDWVKVQLDDSYESFVQDRKVERQILDELFRQLEDESLF